MLIFPIIALVLAACSGERSPDGEGSDPSQNVSEATDGVETPQVEKIRLPMGFIANVQYAPFYVAVEKGYFAEAGLEIEFDYGFETNGVALVGAEELPFAVVSGEQVLLARAQEIPVVYVLAWFQDYPIAVIAKQESGIEFPADLAGKQIGLPGLFGASYIGLRALLNAADVSEADVTLDSIGFNQVEALIVDQEQAVVGYVNNEPVQLMAMGHEVNVIRVADYIQLTSNGIITNETTIAENPDLIDRMLSALLRGLEDAIANPDEAYEISKKYIDSLAAADADEEAVQREVLALSIELWRTERLGFSQEEAWENMQEVLLSMGLLAEPMDLEAAFTNEFIP
jgi:NitT/TauT family transport system substrate-binding protein